jgi:hypothetical protein
MAGSCSGLKHKKVKSLCQFGVFLCGPLRISAISALKGYFSAGIAEIRRGPLEKIIT